MIPNLYEVAKLAEKAHEGQTRKWTGSPFILHPMRVANRIALFGLNERTVAAAMLHDTLEDTSLSPDTIAQVAGCGVLELVQMLTNPSKKYPEKTRKAKKAMDREHAKGIHWSAKAIKLADRADNLRDMLPGAPVDFCRLYASESVLLLEALAGTAPALEAELLDAIEAVQKAAA